MRPDNRGLTQLNINDLPPEAKASQVKFAFVTIDPPGERIGDLLRRGVTVPGRNGRSLTVRYIALGNPFRADSGGRRDQGGFAEGKGWWSQRVRSEFGAESVLLIDPKSRRVNGTLRVLNPRREAASKEVA